MFNNHFLPIILLCFFTKTAFWGTCFCISASFFRHFRGSQIAKIASKITFSVKEGIKFGVFLIFYTFVSCKCLVGKSTSNLKLKIEKIIDKVYV